MIARRELLFFALLPLGLVGGAALRLKEKVMASPIVPQSMRWQYIEYFWTDGSENWGKNLHDAPKEAGSYMVWPGSDSVAQLGNKPVTPEVERIARENGMTA